MASPPPAAYPVLLAFGGAANDSFVVCRCAACWHLNIARCRAWLQKHPGELASAKSIQRGEHQPLSWGVVIFFDKKECRTHFFPENPHSCEQVAKREKYDAQYDTDIAPPRLGA